jgi:hypothetical protein
VDIAYVLHLHVILPLGFHSPQRSVRGGILGSLRAKADVRASTGMDDRRRGLVKTCLAREDVVDRDHIACAIDGYNTRSRP